MPFFLSSVVQSPDLEDQTLSESQALPPIDDTDISFDDTVAGDFSAPDETSRTITDFDDSIEISEDDIELGLGDIMPIDLDQLDMPGEGGEELNLDSTEVLPTDDQEISLEDIDLDFGEDLADQSSEFDATEILSTDTFDEDINLDITGDFDQSIDLDLSGDFEAMDLDDTTISDESEGLNLDDTLSHADNLVLDDELQASLTGDFPATDHDETEVLGLDGSLFEGEEEEQLQSDIDFEEGLTDFELDETDISSESALEDTADTLSLDEELQASLAAETAAENEEPEALGIDDTMLEELEAERSGEEQFAAESDAGLTDFELEETGVGASLEAEDFNSGDTISESEVFDLESDLQVELDDAESEDAESLGDELLATMNEELDLDFAGELETGDDQGEDASVEDIGFQAADEEEQLVDESLSATDEDDDLEFASSPALGLEDIDVSDLISSPEQQDEEELSSDDDAELDLASLVEEEDDKSEVDLELLNDSIPEMEILKEEDDEGPPDLP